MSNNINWQKVEKPFRNTELYTVPDIGTEPTVPVLFLLHDDVEYKCGNWDGSEFYDEYAGHGYEPPKVANYAVIGLPAGHAEAVAKLEYDQSHKWAVVRFRTRSGDCIGVDEPGDGVARLTFDEAEAQCTEIAAELGLPIYDGEEPGEVVEVYEPRSTETVIALDNPTMADATMRRV